MSMPRERMIGRAVSIAAALGGGIAGYDFGLRLDGVLIGVVAAVNLAVLGALLGDSATDWVFRRLGRSKGEA
jgi:hypothetical protein